MAKSIEINIMPRRSGKTYNLRQDYHRMLGTKYYIAQHSMNGDISRHSMPNVRDLLRFEASNLPITLFVDEYFSLSDENHKILYHIYKTFTRISIIACGTPVRAIRKEEISLIRSIKEAGLNAFRDIEPALSLEMINRSYYNLLTEPDAVVNRQGTFRGDVEDVRGVLSQESFNRTILNLDLEDYA